MRVRAKMMSECLRRPIRSAGATLLATGAALLSFTAPARAQTYGYSYMHMEIGGHPITNFVYDQKYAGWLQIQSVSATLTGPVAGASGEAASGNAAPKVKKVEGHWDKLPAILHSGRASAGKITFGAGDDGQLQPLVDAQKHKSLLASADIDVYEEDGGALIGKYRLKGIRVLSLNDVTASACPMYSVTMSFQSAEKL